MCSSQILHPNGIFNLNRGRFARNECYSDVSVCSDWFLFCTPFNFRAAECAKSKGIKVIKVNQVSDFLYINFPTLFQHTSNVILTLWVLDGRYFNHFVLVDFYDFSSSRFNATSCLDFTTTLINNPRLWQGRDNKHQQQQQTDQNKPCDENTQVFIMLLLFLNY